MDELVDRRVVISSWNIEQCGDDLQFWTCVLCPDATVVVRDRGDVLHLIEHQLDCNGIPRDVARELEARARSLYRGWARRPHL